MNVDPEFLENHHIIGRLKLTELLERQSPFRELKDSVERRFSLALEGVPEAHKEAVLTLFATTIYLPRPLLDESWRYLWDVVSEKSGVHRLKSEDVLVLELDRDLLRDEFYRSNSLVGRLQDNLPWRSTHDIIDSLRIANGEWFANPNNQTFAAVLRRPVWMLLVDITLSGTSVLSECKRLRAIHRVLFPGLKAPHIVAVIQVATETAIATLRDEEMQIVTAVVVPKTHALGLPEYRAVADPRIVRAIHDACDWFAQTYVIPSQYRFGRLCRDEIERSGEAQGLRLAAYGFGKAGWTIATYKNTPNNAVPLLWFRPESDEYLPPFERIDSRTRDTWSGRTDWLDALQSNEAEQAALRTLLFKDAS
ncbi:MAG: hypothetical protein IPK33_08320 [Gemmatimonadetes bacterium]|nr:hypothetical protein [Gemmatimonadota bacterium]